MRAILQSTMLIAAACVATTIAACASAGGGQGRSCAALPRDSVYRASGVVYRQCAVDHAARQINTNVHPAFTPNTNGGQTCYSAEFEFVVDETGHAETRTIQELHANDRAFASSVADVIPTLVFEPAMIGSDRVKQIVSYKQGVSVMKVVARAGEPVRPPAQRAPGC